MKDDGSSIDTMQSFCLLVSSIAGRGLQIAAVEPGEPAWTDGKTIFVDSALSERDQLVAVIVQASLLSTQSFSSAILQKMKRDAVLARRYLAIEGHRALAASQDRLPALMLSFIDRNIASRSDSPSASLAIAMSREVIADPPACFGIIQARRLLAMNESAPTSGAEQTQVHTPRQTRDQSLQYLEDEDEEDDNSSSVAIDMFSVAGGAGALGRWLQKLLKAVRHGQGGAGGSPGIDAASHRSRNSTSRTGRSVVSSATMSAFDDETGQSSGVKYPEWDMYKKQYRQDWCTVQEVTAPQKQISEPAMPDSGSLRKPLARIALGLDHCHRQTQGDDIDIDAAIEARIEVLAGSMPEETVYVNSLRRRRDLSVLILLDISGSSGEPGAEGVSVHEQQRAAASALSHALHNLGDRVALYAYNSQGRSAVQLMPVKRFDEHFNSLTLQRLHSLVPAAYSRLGAAIRHGANILEQQGGTPRRLLLVLSDGLAYDHGYERDYGAADARRALAEARRRGTGSLCITIGASTDAESLQRVFGSASHATISKNSELGNLVGTLFRSTLRSAEVRRRVS